MSAPLKPGTPPLGDKSAAAGNVTGRAGRDGAGSGGGHRSSMFSRILGRQPIGMLFTAPYAIFIAVIFAYPLGYAVWMSFHDFFFTAPGVTVPHPFVGLRNYRSVLGDPDVRASFIHVGVFLLIKVPLTVALSLLLAV